MPLMRCNTKGRPGWKWGESGKCYPGKKGRNKAIRQKIAIQYSLQRRKQLIEALQGIGVNEF